MTTLGEREATRILLVRAAEEKGRGLFSAADLSDAALAALDARDDLELLDRRSAWLAAKLPRSLDALARMVLAPQERAGPVLAASVFVGLASNALGPSGRVHVAYNPLTFLLAWNLVVYAALLARRLGRWSDARRGAASAARAGGEGSRTLLFEAFERWIALRARLAGGRDHVPDAAAVAMAFTRAWWEAASGIALARLGAVVHAGAVGVLAGALVGTYLRGLFFEYDAVWRSTFLTDPASVADFLNVLLGPAGLILDGRLLDAAAVAPLLSPEGDAAGPWIHRLALTSLLVVALPRLLLAAASARRAAEASRSIRIDLAEPWYAARIAEVREGLGNRLRGEVTATFQAEVTRLSESVADFVRERFFDETVTPLLHRFRSRGGKVKDLEAGLAEATTRFEPELASHLASGRQAMQEALADSVRRVIGRDIAAASALVTATSPGALRLDSGVPASVASNVGDQLGLVVTAAVTATAATVSGGVGKSLGIAVLSSLLGTSGPVGLLLGGLAGATVMGGAYILGRERVGEAVKGWTIPGSVASLALRDARIAQARDEAWRKVKDEIRATLEPQAGQALEGLMKELPLLVRAGSEVEKKA